MMRILLRCVVVTNVIFAHRECSQGVGLLLKITRIIISPIKNNRSSRAVESRDVDRFQKFKPGRIPKRQRMRKILETVARRTIFVGVIFGNACKNANI